MRAGFEHRGLCYGSNDELVAAVVPFVEDGLRGGIPVHVNLEAEHVAVVRRALGATASRVGWSDTSEWLPHPARRLRAIEDLVSMAGPVRFVGELPAAATADRAVEWERFDAVLNHGLAGFPVTMLCVYDTALPAAVIGRVPMTHPYLGDGDSPAWCPTAEFLAAHPVPALAVPDTAVRLGPGLLPAAARGAVRAAFGADADDLVVAVTEVVTNALRASPDWVVMACWSTGDEAVVQVDDAGPGLFDPLAGYRRPSTGAESGRGLWMARQLTDLVHICAGPEGTSVQLRLRRA